MISQGDYLLKPILPSLKSRIRGIYNGFKHSILVTQSNEIVTFGSNAFGQYVVMINIFKTRLGSTDGDFITPQLLALEFGHRFVVKAACGFEHSFLYSGLLYLENAYTSSTQL